jgi:phage portal protein BeeE
MEYNGNFFENGAQTGVVFSMENSNGEEATRNREYLETHYVGVRNAHRPILLEGAVTVGSSVPKQQEMEFTLYRMQNRQEILSVLFVDPTKLGIHEDANRSIAKEAEDGFHNETIAEWQQVVEEEINNSLVLRVMEISDTLFKHAETDPRTQYANLKNYREAEIGGIFNVDEIRGRLGLGPVKGGDVHFIQTAAGLIPLSMVSEIAERLVIDNTVGAKPGTGLGTNDNPPNAPVEGEDEDEND